MLLQGEEKGVFYHHYQPIYNIQRGNIVAYEGLFRSNHHLNPEETFKQALERNELFELDLTSVQKAFHTYAQAGYLASDLSLCMNVFPSTVSDPFFLEVMKQLVREYHVTEQKLILEINENETFHFQPLIEGISIMKELGICIAIDDFGTGSSSIQAYFELNPDIVKLDRYFMKDILTSERKQDAIRYILEFCEKFDTRLIVEGVEDQESLALIQRLGVVFAQGYFLGRPAPLFTR